MSNGSTAGTAQTGATGPGIGHNSGKGTKNDLHDTVAVGEAWLEKIRANGEDVLIVADEKGIEHFWRYRDGLWSLWMKPGPRLEAEIEQLLQELEIRWVSTSRFVAEARKYIERCPSVWTHARIVWDDHGKVPTRSGLIDPVTLEIEPLRKDHHATWQIDVEYDPAAKCPLWDELLATYFEREAVDAKRLTLLQDFAGTMLVDRLPKALKRALVLLGASDTGKSTLLRTLWRMLTDKPISVPFSALASAHGLQEFMRRAPWVLDEAFNIGIWHFSDLVKSIISGDTLSINPKNLAMITIRICTPCMWGTNHPPTFKENTDAIVNRLLIVQLKRVFDKDKRIGVATKAKAANPAWEPDDLIHARERAGLLNWMLIGLQRALKRGNFENTAEGEAALDAMRREANPVSGFIRDCIRFDPTMMMSTTDFYAAFTGWREETHGGEKASLSPDIVGKNLRALSHPWIGQNKDVFKEEDGRRYYMGIVLSAEGCAHFDEVRKTKYRRSDDGPLKRMSLASENVGKTIPEKWRDHPEVVRLKKRRKDS